MLHSHHLLSHLFPLSSSYSHPTHLHPLRPFSLKPSALPQSSSLAQAQSQDPATQIDRQESEDVVDSDGPVELPPSLSYSPFSTTPIFSVDDNPSPLQVSTGVLLTGAISVFLFRSLRRRARRAKELRVRSTGMKTTKDIKEEALESLKAMGAASVDPGGPPSPVQAFLGGIAAGAIALILYKFATTVEAGLNRQTISDNFSVYRSFVVYILRMPLATLVRQITITIRTIINGICYLATFVFGINSIGLLLYSVQLTFNSFMENPADNPKSGKEGDRQLNMTNDAAKISTDNADSTVSSMKESPDDN